MAHEKKTQGIQTFDTEQPFEPLKLRLGFNLYSYLVWIYTYTSRHLTCRNNDFA